MPVNYTPPAPADLLPVPGVALGTAAAKIKNWQRDDVLLAVFESGSLAAGVFTQNRFCAAPVTVCRRHLGAGERAAPIRALIVNAGNANAGTGAARGRRGRVDLRGGRVDAGLHAAGSAAVLHRRDHGAAAAGQDRRRAAGRARRAGARPLVPRGVGDHDHRHGAQGRVAARGRRRRDRHRHRHRQGCRDDPSEHGDDAVVHRHRRAASAPGSCRSSRARSPTSRSTVRPSTATRRPTTASSSPPPAARRWRRSSAPTTRASHRSARR